MTRQEAIRLLRTEQPGDSEWMELAKQMGANALEHQHLHFMAPKCEACGFHILGVEIAYGLGYVDTVLMKNIDPSACPHCGTAFVRVDINYEEQTVILKGE